MFCVEPEKTVTYLWSNSTNVIQNWPTGLVHLCPKQWKQKTQKVQDNRNIFKIKNSASNLYTLHLIYREHFLLSLYKPRSVPLKSHCFIKPSVTRSQNYNLNNLPIFYFSTVQNIIIFIVIFKKSYFSHQAEVGSFKILTTYFITSIFILVKRMTLKAAGGKGL